MVNPEEVSALTNWKAKGKVLSLYLEMTSDWNKNFQNPLEASAKSLLHPLESKIPKEEIPAFQSILARVMRFFQNAELKGRSLVIFAAPEIPFFWVKEFKVSLAPQAVWHEKPYLLPLWEAMDEHERYAVAVVEKAQAKIASFFLGEIEEEHDLLAGSPVQHSKTTGRDNLRSERKIERTHEMHAEWHYKRVVEALKTLNKKRPFDRLIFGGTQEALREILKFLPPVLKKKSLSGMHVPVHSRAEDLKETIRQIEFSMEREAELRMVEKILWDNPASRTHAVGIDAVLQNVAKKQVQTLIYSENYQPVGSACKTCGHLYSGFRNGCGLCGGIIGLEPYFLNAVAQQVVLNNGRIERVRGTAAELLDLNGAGIAAVLKFKTSRLQAIAS
jgi:hypothetical protein